MSSFAYVLLCLLALVPFVTSAYCQTDETMAGMQMGESQMDIAHPFFTHMGMPEGVGNYALRVAGIATTDDGETDGNFGLHLETGLSKTIGLHIRNERVLTTPHTEVAFQFAAVSSRDGMSGFSPFMEFEIPTHSGEKTIYTLVGFSTAWTTDQVALNQSVEYSPKEEGLEGSASAVVKVGTRFFPVVEFIGEAAEGSSPLYTALGGLKGRINEHFLVGLAYEVPTSDEREFDYQILLQTDVEW
jgi:hypothetical protein